MQYSLKPSPTSSGTPYLPSASPQITTVTASHAATPGKTYYHWIRACTKTTCGYNSSSVTGFAGPTIVLNPGVINELLKQPSQKERTPATRIQPEATTKALKKQTETPAIRIRPKTTTKVLKKQTETPAIRIRPEATKQLLKRQAPLRTQ